MSEKTVIVIVPSIYASNKINELVSSISKILEINNRDYSTIRKNKSLVIVEAFDPVLASSSISLLFGIEKIAIAREIESDFNRILENITNVASSLLLQGEKFHVKIEGQSEKFVAKDLEIAASAAIIEKSKPHEVKPSKTDYHKLLYTFVTETQSYVCIFTDDGLGGLPLYSQKEEILCCVYDELSAISCLQSIKMGLRVKILLCYKTDTDLLKIAKIINRLLPRLCEKNIIIDSCKIPDSSVLTTIETVTQTMIRVAKKKKIKRIALGISPSVFPIEFCEHMTSQVNKHDLIPWIPLAGIDKGILDNAKEIGLEKYSTNLQDLCKKKRSYKKSDSIALDNAKNAFTTIKSINIKLGPNNVHDIIDQIKAWH